VVTKLSAPRSEAVAPRGGRIARRGSGRVALIYAVGAVVVVGWAAHLGISLPDVNMARHWNVAWVGFDAMIVSALSWTAWRAWHRDRRVVVPAVATATLLVVDAWMDISTATRGDLWQSILLAACLELPLAALSLMVARRAVHALANSHAPRSAPAPRQATHSTTPEPLNSIGRPRSISELAERRPDPSPAGSDAPARKYGRSRLDEDGTLCRGGASGGYQHGQ